jgi:RNA polymerase-binding protein DksA
MSQFALTTQQIDDLRQLLLQRYGLLSAAVSADLHADDDSHTSITGTSDADWTTADVDADTLIAKAERDAKELSETAAALEKVDDGRYGVCETCGEAIGYARLLAYPSARRCLSCQKSAETRAGSAGGG